MSQADFETVISTSKRWMQAWINQDRATLESILAPDYALIVSTGPDHRFERGDWLTTAVGPYVCTRFAYEAIQVRAIADDLMAMSAIADFDASMAGIDRSGRFFVTDLWRRRDGRWQVCARYSSPPSIAEESVRAMVDFSPR